MISDRTQARLVPVSSLTAFSEVVPASYAEELLDEHASTLAVTDILAEALKGLVGVNEAHNEAISKIMGTPIGWKDTYLDAARAAITCYNNHVTSP